MTKRIVALIISVFLTAAPLAGIAMAAADCSSQPGCCHGSVKRTHYTGEAMIGSAHGCCCAAAGEVPCTYTPSQLPKNATWALSTVRTDAPVSTLSGMSGFSTNRIDLQAGLMPAAEVRSLHIVSPPAYLSLMSLLR